MKTNIKQQCKKLAAHTRRLMDSGEFVREKSGREYYTVMSLLLIDAVLQAGMRYETVQGRVSKFADENPKVQTVGQFKALIRKKPLGKILSWTGPKVETLKRLINLLAGEKIDNVGQFRRWVVCGDNRKKLLNTKGVGKKTVDYLRLLVGDDGVAAIDTHLEAFLREAGVETRGYDDAWEIVKCAAQKLKMKVADYDASIWHYMRNKKKGK